MLTVPLRPYQDEAVDKFLDRGSLLVGYEMGLGKTLIAIGAAEHLIGAMAVRDCMIVVPSGLKLQWAQSIAKHTDVDTETVVLRGQEFVLPSEKFCVVIDGTPTQREQKYKTIKDVRPDYIIISYDTVVTDWDRVRRIKPDMIVLDEATAIKSFRAQRTKKVKRLTAPWRMALTGTPVENGKPEEIFSIMQWVDEEVLGRFDLFDRAYVVRNDFGGVQRYRNLPVLHEKLSEVMHSKSRLDEDVRPYMPEVDEGVWTVTADTKTMKLYKKIANDLLAELQNLTPQSTFDVFAHYHGTGEDNTAMGRAMSRHLALEMLLDHPDLLLDSAWKYKVSQSEQAKGVQKKNWPGSSYAHELVEAGALDGLLKGPHRSAKLDLLVEKVGEILARPKNKVIVFTQYRGMLDLIEEELNVGQSRVACTQYHGDMDATAKAASQKRFEDDPDCRVFLSSHAGGFGVDLFMANYLINYDQAWSSGKQDQINARHVRASSRFAQVFVRTLVTAGTVEERKYDLVALKRRVASAIQHGTGADEKGRILNDTVALGQYLAESLRP